MSRLVEIWPGVMAHASGGLWLESSRTLALADLHLGYGWAQRRRGELGPLADAETRTKLLRVLDELLPAKVLLVGDIVHAPKPGKEEFAFVESVLSAVTQRTELVVAPPLTSSASASVTSRSSSSTSGSCCSVIVCSFRLTIEPF